MEHKKRFLNFPIALLRGFPENHKSCMLDIFLYSVYGLVYSDEQLYDSLEDFLVEWEIDFLTPSEKIHNLFQSRGEELYNSFCGTKHVWTGIHIDTWRSYNHSKRTRPELMVLLAHLALKSIIQKKAIQRNTSDYLILARMAGFDALEGNEIPEFICQYMKKQSRTRTKLFQDLEIHFGFKRKEKSRGVTYSYTLSLAELEFEIAKSRYLSKERKLNEKKAEERLKAKEQFNQWLKVRKQGESL
ncbi:MAG: hypothetical protein C0433_14420 [Cyclobacterium sp.]|nr:hypothetical protein [Cyclobacterium sp.]